MIETFEKGKIVTIAAGKEVDQLPWNKHATCQGVFLKHLITGSETDGKFSCHIVRVQAGYEISDHTHQNNWEIHEVVEGNGLGYLGDQEIPYVPGTTVPVPQGKQHKVVAGKQDLYLLAKFIPALV